MVGVAGHADPCDGDEDGDNENGDFHVGYERFYSPRQKLKSILLPFARQMRPYMATRIWT